MSTVSDTFTRANETPLAAPWTKVIGNSINLSSNALLGASSGTDSYYYYSGSGVGVDQFAEASYAQITLDDWGPAVRINGAGHGGAVAEGYFYDITSGGGLSRHNNGVFVSLTASAPAHSIGDVVRIEVQGIGNNIFIRGYVNGVLKTSITDVGVSVGGNGLEGAGNGVGFFMFNMNSADNFNGGDLSAAPSPSYEQYDILHNRRHPKRGPGKPDIRASSIIQPEASLGTALSDADTGILSLIGSSADTIDAIEANTGVLAFTPSAVDTEQTVDSDTLPFSLIPTALQEGSVYVDSGTIGLGLVGSSTDTFQGTDQSTASIGFQPATVAEPFAGVDAGTTPLSLLPASTGEGITHFDAGTVGTILTPIGTDTAQYVETGSANVNLTASSTDAADFTDSTSVRLSTTPSSSDVANYVESGTVAMAFSPVGVETAAFTDASTLRVNLSASGTEVASGISVDSGTTTLALSPTATDAFVASDSSAPAMILTPSAGETMGRVDNSTVSIGVLPSGTDVALLSDARAALLGLSPLTLDTIQAVDSGNVTLTTTVGGSDTYGRSDTNTVPFLFTISYSENRGYSDTVETPLSLVPSATDIGPDRTDQGTIRIALMPITTAEIYKPYRLALTPYGPYGYAPGIALEGLLTVKWLAGLSTRFVTSHLERKWISWLRFP